MGWRRVREESSLAGWSDSGADDRAGQDRDLGSWQRAWRNGDGQASGLLESVYKDS